LGGGGRNLIKQYIFKNNMLESKCLQYCEIQNVEYFLIPHFVNK